MLKNPQNIAKLFYVLEWKEKTQRSTQKTNFIYCYLYIYRIFEISEKM